MTSVPAYHSTAAPSHLKCSPETSSAQSGEDAPPPYENLSKPSPLPNIFEGPTVYNNNNMSKTIIPLSLSEYLHTHQIIGIYKASYSDMALALSATAPPISYVSIHSISRPHVELRSTCNPNSPILATAEFKSFSSTMLLAALSPSRPITTQFSHSGAFSSASTGFDLVLPGSRTPERFEWRRSSAQEVASLEGRSRGLKLVRAGSEEVLAVFAGVSGWSTQKKGKFRWVGGKGGVVDVGEEGEMLCVVSLLALLEKSRRSSKSSGAAMAGASAGSAA